VAVVVEDPAGVHALHEVAALRPAVEISAVLTSDEDVIVQKVWVDGRYRKPADALSH
jgi:hypothetical protein